MTLRVKSLPAIEGAALMLLPHLGDQEATATVAGFFLAVRAGLTGLDAALDREGVGSLFELLARHFLRGGDIKSRERTRSRR